MALSPFHLFFEAFLLLSFLLLHSEVAFKVLIKPFTGSFIKCYMPVIMLSSLYALFCLIIHLINIECFYSLLRYWDTTVAKTQ